MKQTTTAELNFANDISNYLSQQYRGHNWAAQVDFEQGIMKILLYDVQPSNMPMIIRLAEVDYSVKKLQSVLRQRGGELLERYGFRREAQTRAQARDEISRAEKDWKGKVLFDAQGVPNWIGQESSGNK